MFNELFLGERSTVDISTEQTPEKIKLYLSEKFQIRKPDHLSWLGNQVDQNSSMFSYSTRNEKIKIYFTRKPVVRFSGTLERINNGSRFKGTIGMSGWMWAFNLIWFVCILAAFCQAFLIDSESFDKNILSVFLLIGVIVMLFNILSLRKAAAFMKHELENFFKVVNPGYTVS
jgi:hypothetical protein